MRARTASAGREFFVCNSLKRSRKSEAQRAPMAISVYESSGNGLMGYISVGDALAAPRRLAIWPHHRP
jgi:hypothetical protein